MTDCLEKSPLPLHGTKPVVLNRNEDTSLNNRRICLNNAKLTNVFYKRENVFYKRNFY